MMARVFTIFGSRAGAMGALMVAASGWAAPPSETPTSQQDLLNLDAGAVVVSYSSQWDEEWAALLLLDDTPEKGWSAGKGTELPHEIVVELAERSRLTSLAFDNSGALEADYPGLSARGVEIWASTESPDSGFEKLVEAEAKQGERSVVTLPEPTEAVWLKFVITSNWGHPEYTELMELEAYGEPLGAPDQTSELAGVYDTNYELMRFAQDDQQVRGCYDFRGGTLTGSTNGRVVQFEWREKEGALVGTAVMVLSHSGEQLNGLWYQDGRYQGLWFGSPAKPGQEPACALPAGDGLEQSLAESGRAIVYGIRFDVDSARLLPRSTATLREALGALRNQPDLALIVEGHTDAAGDAAYNRDLSQRRADAVVNWLVEHGVERKRLEARGAGEARPVASNDTAQGRALNRRVELERRQ